MVCQFLLYNKVNQLYIYTQPHISSLLRLPPTLPIPPLQVDTKHRADLPVLCGCFPLASYLTHSLILKQTIETLKRKINFFSHPHTLYFIFTRDKQTDIKHCAWMTTTKATMIAITKHETHSYYVIILTFSPVIQRKIVNISFPEVPFSQFILQSHQLIRKQQASQILKSILIVDHKSDR